MGAETSVTGAGGPAGSPGERGVPLVYDEQTTGPETEQVPDAAPAAGGAVVPVTETLPDGEDHLSWTGGDLDAVVAALSA